MRNLFVLIVTLFVVGACSSNEKKDMESAEKNVKEQAKDMKESAEKKMDEAKSEAKEAMGSKASCTLDKDTRVIEVKKTESGGCELFYTKFGEAKSVATSGFGTQYCEEVKDRIQTNLNKAGFACK